MWDLAPPSVRACMAVLPPPPGPTSAQIGQVLPYCRASGNQYGIALRQWAIYILSQFFVG